MLTWEALLGNICVFLVLSSVSRLLAEDSTAPSTWIIEETWWGWKQKRPPSEQRARTGMTFHPPIPCSLQFIAQGQGLVQRHTDTRPEGTEKPNLHTSVRPYSLMNAQNGHLHVQRIRLKKYYIVWVWSGVGETSPSILFASECPSCDMYFLFFVFVFLSPTPPASPSLPLLPSPRSCKIFYVRGRVFRHSSLIISSN